MTWVSGVSVAGSPLGPSVQPGLPAAPWAQVRSAGQVGVPGTGQQVVPRGQAGGSFAEVIGRALEELSALENRADDLTARMARGEPVELHEVVIASEKAQLALELAVQLRNRVVEAYQEIMRMPV